MHVNPGVRCNHGGAMGWKSNILNAVVLIIALKVGHVMYEAGSFKRMYFHGPECVLKKGAPGAEDIQVVDGIAYGTSDQRRLWQFGGDRTKLVKAAPQGFLWRYLLDRRQASTAQIVPLTMVGWDSTRAFHPHGLYLIRRGDQLFSYVVNHEAERDTIEIFQIEDGKAILQESVAHPLVKHVNDIVVVGDDIIVTNWQHYEPGTFMHYIEQFGQMPWHYVARCSKASSVWDCSILVDGYAMANGIASSEDGDKLYICETLQKRMHVYDYDAQTGDIVLDVTVPLNSGCDNLDVQKNRVYVGAHPQMLKFVAHKAMPDFWAPSQVLLVSFWENKKNETKFATQDIFLHDGSELSASSVGVFDFPSQTMLVGAVFDDGILVCDAPDIYPEGCPFFG